MHTHIYNKVLTVAVLAVLSLTATAARHEVSLPDVASCLSAAKPGDKIYVKDGDYRDVQLRWSCHGTKKRPITVEALNPGGVRIGGGSTLRLSGEWLSVSGLHFTNGYSPKGAVVEFRDGHDMAYDCRLTNCAIDNYNPTRRDVSYCYVVLYGQRNRIDHCSLTGKLNLGVTLCVFLNDACCLENHHRIDHNYFGERPVYGSNGAETIRVGTSQQALSSSFTVIEDNLFERCSGEVEIVSIKSCDNTIRQNTFLECGGVVALRHGDRNTVNGNLFIGHNRRNTGGIRVVNAGHSIYDNTLVGLCGTRFFSALAVMNAVPNSLPNRYCQVSNVKIYNNTFVDCTNIEFGTGRDMERTLAPSDVFFTDNVIVNRNLQSPYIALCDMSGMNFSNNKARLAADYKATGFTTVDLATPKLSDEANLRNGRGASWFDNRLPSVADSEHDVYHVSEGDNLCEAVAKAKSGGVIVIDGGTYSIKKAILVDKPLTLRAANLASKPLIRFNGDKSDNMVTIADGGDLRLENMAFSGTLELGRALAKAGISTAQDMIKPYTLVIDGCEFSDFGESGCFAVKGTKGTFAHKIIIKDCLFRDLSGGAINFAAEKDDIGRYNADDIIIENCSFHRLLGLPVNIYRGGSDESTAGPYVTVRHCNFTDCCNKERGSVLRLIGPQILTVEKCNFDNSGRGGAAIRLDEATWEKVCISDCNLWLSGRIMSTTGNAIKGAIRNIAPAYVNAKAFDYTPTLDSELARLGIGVNKTKNNEK